MNCKKAYKQELLKQTEPYLYYLNVTDNKERGTKVAIEGPLPCVINISGIEAFAYECTIFPARITDETDTITYVILKTPDVRYHDLDSAEQLIGLGMEKTEKLIPDLIYSDNDFETNNGKRHTPFFKPDYSMHTLADANYIGGLAAVRKEVLMDVLAEVDDTGSRDMMWKLLLDITRHSAIITHVTECLWYTVSDDTSESIYTQYAEYYLKPSSLGIRTDALKKMGVYERSDYTLSIVIPSKDHSGILIKCIESIKNKTGFNQNKENEILIIDNGSYLKEREKIEQYISENSDLNIKYIYEPSPFNYSAMCNKGASLAKGNLLLFVNDDVEAVDGDFIDHMAEYALSEKVGAVGVRLMYPSGNKIQHVGITCLDSGPTHKLATYDNDKTYYFGVNRLSRNCLGVTGACLMVEREKFFKVNGFYDKMEVSYNDVDLCVNLYEAGYNNVVLCDDFLIHHESLSRGSDIFDRDKYLRLSAERKLFCERHLWLIKGTDPFYNPNLIGDTLDYRPNVAADYEVRDRLSPVEVLSYPSGMKAFRDRLKLNVEKVSLVPSLSDPEMQYIEFEGWSLYRKHDNRLYKRKILFIADDGTKIIAVTPFMKYRPDIGEVFPEDKYTELAGFYARIPECVLKTDMKYRIALIYEHRIFHTKVITYGDYYESGQLLQDPV